MQKWDESNYVFYKNHVLFYCGICRCICPSRLGVLGKVNVGSCCFSKQRGLILYHCPSLVLGWNGSNSRQQPLVWFTVSMFQMSTLTRMNENWHPMLSIYESSELAANPRWHFVNSLVEPLCTHRVKICHCLHCYTFCVILRCTQSYKIYA